MKAFQEFTHKRRAATERDVGNFRRAVEPLFDAGRLSAVLVQFPWSFRYGSQATRYIEVLENWLAPLPVVVEVRHGSWGDEAALAFFEGRRLSLCAIDQPQIGRSLPPNRFCYGRAGAYHRLHGRNYTHWFSRERSRDRRYDYMYSEEEMKAVRSWIEPATLQAEKVHIVFNNHFEGQAVANALELRAMLEGKVGSAPRGVLERYPRLAGKLEEDSTHREVGAQPGLPSLFDEAEQNNDREGPPADDL